jgi:hypothetical protein
VRPTAGFDHHAVAKGLLQMARDVQAHLSVLMTYRSAADVLEQMFPVGVGKDKETMRRHTLRAGAVLRKCTAIEPETRAAAIAVTHDSRFSDSGC